VDGNLVDGDQQIVPTLDVEQVSADQPAHWYAVLKLVKAD
jgi:hypothetical protein